MTKSIAEILDASIFDGLQNMIANLGTGQDKRSHNRFINTKRLSSQVHAGGCSELDELYRGNWVAGKLVDIIPDDMTREWRTHISEDPAIIAAIEKEEKRLALPYNFNEAHKWARLYGTSGILLGLNDGKSLEEPVDLDDIQEGDLKYIKPIDRTMMYQDISNTVELTLDPTDPNFGLPEYYRMINTSKRVHNSRILRFDGVKLPHYQMQHNGYMSDSILDRLYDPILDFTIATQAASSMIHNMNQDVVSIEGLMQMLQTKDGEALIQKRWSMVALWKSFNNMLIIDSKETVTKHTQTFSGIPDLIDKYGKIVGSGGDVPATRFMGSSPGGLNATGESDLRNYYNMLRSRQKNEYGPKLDFFDTILVKNIGIDPDSIDLSYEWNSLDHLTEKERADIQKVHADRDAIYIREGVVDEITVARQLQKDRVYSDMSPELFEEPEEPEEEEDPVPPKPEEDPDEEEEEDDSGDD